MESIKKEVIKSRRYRRKWSECIGVENKENEDYMKFLRESVMKYKEEKQNEVKRELEVSFVNSK